MQLLHAVALQPKEIGLPFTAYYAIDEIREVRQDAVLCYSNQYFVPSTGVFDELYV
jgi:hypothetical protein